MQSLLGEAILTGGSRHVCSKQGMSPPNQPNHMGLGNACSHSYRKRQSSTIAPGELLLPSATQPLLNLDLTPRLVFHLKWQPVLTTCWSQKV